MKRLARAAVLTRLRDRLEERGSWCGETHLQKAAYLLQEATGVPLGFDFFLYKFGPFSFDLRSELTDLRSDTLLELRPQAYPYGPRLMATTLTKRLQSRFPNTLNRYDEAITAVAEFVGERGVAALERVSTAALLLIENHGLGKEGLVEEIGRVKPHIGEQSAERAIDEAELFLANVASKFREGISLDREGH